MGWSTHPSRLRSADICCARTITRVRLCVKDSCSSRSIAEAQRNQAEVAYEKAVQTAFREVSDALIAHQRTHESRLEQEKLVGALEDRKRLAYVRYRGGVDTQLNALDADRDLFQAELALAQLRYNELAGVVQLYKALGGGWQS